MPPPDTAGGLLAARRHFFVRGSAPEDAVARPILRSWMRCTELGLDGQSLPRVEPLSSRELRELVERNDALRQLCRPEIEALHADAKVTDSVVLLTDAAGLVLDT